MSAELGVVSPENEGLQYLTVTYHSEGHTSGEPPVDSRRYVVPRVDPGPPPTVTIRAERAVLMAPGTLEKEGFTFIDWAPRQWATVGSGDDGAAGLVPGDMFFDGGGRLDPGDLISIIAGRESWVEVRQNMDLDAVWWPLSQ
jgi:hypothetical protein